jgi:hypothetical protein
MDTDKPQVVYGSRAYKVLCYGKMKDKPFLLEEMKMCLSGVFRRSGFYDMRPVLEKLSEKSLLKYEQSSNKWVITDAGIKEIIESVAYYRVKREREVGARFMTMIREEMVKTTLIGPYMSGEQMDAEDAVIERLNKKMWQRSSRKYKRVKKVLY